MASQSSKITNSNSNSNANHKINVCIRMRPILPNYEDDEVWSMNYKENMVHSLNNNIVQGFGDPMNFALNGAQGNVREKELRRRY
jgi:hypothetical protein